MSMPATGTAEWDALYIETGGASANEGFNYEAHLAATGGNASTGGTTTSSAATADDSTGYTSSESQISADVKALTSEQRDDLYAQVGDAMYAPGFSLAGHIAVNTFDGVFFAPSKDGSSTLSESEVDWLGIAKTNGLDLEPWLANNVYLDPEERDEFERLITSDVITAMSSDVAELDEALKADLFSQVGTAMYSPGFSLAAHIAANIQDGIFVSPRSDDSDSSLESSIDWLNWANENSVDLSPWEVKKVDVDSSFGLENGIIALPEKGSPEWLALMEETGGAAANEGFNYAAHIAAITSQQILTDLSEEEVLSLIRETGKTNFEGFDLASHNATKIGAVKKAEKLVKAKNVDTGSENILVGSAGNDLVDLSKSTKQKAMIVTGAGNDIVRGSMGDNIVIAGTGDDRVDGGDGLDSVVVSDRVSEASVSFDSLSSEWVVESELDGIDRLKNVERIVFEDKALALDTDGVAGQAFRIYKAAFDRDPTVGDTSGLGYWIEQSDDGMDLVEIAARFIDSNEFRDSYGEAPSNGEFITALYRNVLDRDPDQAGYDWWVEQLANNPEKSWEKVLADFSESAENIQNVNSLIQNGIVYDIFIG